MIELELLQGGKGTIALLRELQPAALLRIGLAEPVFSGRNARTPQERQRHDDDAGDGKQDAERKPDAHTANASGLATRSERAPGQASGVAVARRAGTR